jgi:hypothetical protein
MIIAGHPCVDYSSMGTLDKDDGRTMTVFLIFVRLRQLLREDSFLSENVPAFAHSQLQRYLGEIYDFESVVLHNKDFAVPIERARRYTWAWVRSTCSPSRPFASCVKLFGRDRDPMLTYRDLQLAPPAELSCELQWASARKGSRATTFAISPNAPNAFRNALAAWELKHLIAYEDLYGTDQLVFSLAQNPKAATGNRGHCSPKDGETLMCIIRNNHLLWASSVQRWLTMRELLVSQMFPCYDSCLRWSQPGVSTPRALCSFNLSRVAKGFAPRDRVSVSHAAGNSMCVVVVGCAVAWRVAFLDTHATLPLRLSSSMLPLIHGNISKSSTECCSSTADSDAAPCCPESDFLNSIRARKRHRVVARDVGAFISAVALMAQPLHDAPRSSASSAQGLALEVAQAATADMSDAFFLAIAARKAAKRSQRLSSPL